MNDMATDNRVSSIQIDQIDLGSDKNLVLIGMMGSGKTTCGRLLSLRTGRKLVDMDEQIYLREGRTIADIFAQDGEEYFRNLESSVARELSQHSNLIISTGGGVILRPENVAALRENGVVVWLNRPADHIFDSEDLGDRPLAQSGKASFLKTFATREEKYRRAAHIIIEDFSTPQATVDSILAQWKTYIASLSKSFFSTVNVNELSMMVQLKNTSKKLCVIGDPVEHSKSPIIQNTMISALGLDYIYMAQYVERGHAAEWLQAAKTAGYAGFNATMPHKVDLVPLMDHLDQDAQLYRAVNTVAIRNGIAYGYNTDGRGFHQALLDAGIDPTGKNIVILGAGGASKSVSLKMVQQKAKSIHVCNRTLSKAVALASLAPFGAITPAPMDKATLARLLPKADLLINCTSLGMTGVKDQFEDLSFLDYLPQHAAVCDLIYSPAETLFLEQARLRGHKTLNGLDMLIWQAVFALEFFTNTHIDGHAMKQVLDPILNPAEQK